LLWKRYDKLETFMEEVRVRDRFERSETEKLIAEKPRFFKPNGSQHQKQHKFWESVRKSENFKESSRTDNNSNKNLNIRCYNCNELGHLSRKCSRTKTKQSIDAEQKRNAKSPNETSNMDSDRRRENHDRRKESNDRTNEKGNTNPRKFNAAVTLTNIDKPVVPITVGDKNVFALIDTGADVSLIDRKLVNSKIYPWQDTKLKSVTGSFTPKGWVTLETKIGTIEYFVPRVGVCSDLPVPVIF